ncbi:MAG: RNA methyltransferase [Candidatus Gastranaerophilales bacterium]|nr:RNA methyltransferase [Candidatus Gastranaerophilales bacterium]
MQEISSVQNNLIKKVASYKQKKYRNEDGMFVIEGYKNVKEALDSRLCVENIFIDEKFDKILPKFDENKIYKVSEQVMKKMSSTDTPVNIIATAIQPKYTLNEILNKKNPAIVVLENIKDAGNLGTIIRTSAAANISGVILIGDTVDIYNPKTVRSSSANLWKIPIIKLDLVDFKKEILNKNKDFKIYATTLKEGAESKNIYEIDFKQPSILLFGSESDGISEELAKDTDMFVKIPMRENVESLNLSISAGIIIYEIFRQRSFY